MHCYTVPDCPSRLEGIRALMSMVNSQLRRADGASISRSLRNSELRQTRPRLHGIPVGT
jgi:hypothetical protein